MPSVAATYGTARISEAQLRRLYALAYGTRVQSGAFGGNKRDKANQLWELVQRWGYDDWNCVDQHVERKHWLRQCDYDEIIGELLAMKGETL